MRERDTLRKQTLTQSYTWQALYAITFDTIQGYQTTIDQNARPASHHDRVSTVYRGLARYSRPLAQRPCSTSTHLNKANQRSFAKFRVALITGAASGIGRQCAFAFASEGCTRFILADLNASGLNAVSAELQKQYDPAIETCLVEADMSKEEDINRMVAEGVKKFGAIHYCVNNAGVTSRPRVRTHELPVEAWDRVANVNLRGVWLCERAEIGQMMKQGMDLKMR